MVGYSSCTWEQGVYTELQQWDDGSENRDTGTWRMRRHGGISIQDTTVVPMNTWISLGRPRCFTGRPLIRGRLRAPTGAFARTSTFRIGDINGPKTASSRFGHGTPHIPEKIMRRQSVLECFLPMKPSLEPY